MVSYIVLSVLILCSEAILLCLPTVLLHHGHIIIIGSAVKIVLLPWWVRRPRRDPNRQLTLECSRVDRMGWNQFWKSILVLTYGPWSPALFYVLMWPINMNPFCCTLTRYTLHNSVQPKWIKFLDQIKTTAWNYLKIHRSCNCSNTLVLALMVALMLWRKPNIKPLVGNSGLDLVLG